MELTTNPNRIGLDEAYMQMAEVWASRSKANRLQVGALLVKDQQIISDGYNGMPSGVEDDVCEYWDFPSSYGGQDGIGGPPNKELRTKLDVLHAESNTLLKIAKNGGTGAEGATLYTTHSPCPECAKLIKQAGVVRVVFRHTYRLSDGIVLLRKLGVQVQQLLGSNIQPPAPAPAPAQPPQNQDSLLRQLVRNDLIATTARVASPASPAPAAPSTPSKSFDEEDVAKLLREFEEHQQAEAVIKKSSLASPEVKDAPYRSTFF